jgi:hypothetical protein
MRMTSLALTSQPVSILPSLYQLPYLSAVESVDSGHTSASLVHLDLSDTVSNALECVVFARPLQVKLTKVSVSYAQSSRGHRM